MPYGLTTLGRCFLGSVLVACGGLQTLPPGVGRAMAEAPEDLPVRFLLRGDELVGVSVPVGRGGLGQDLRRVVDAIQPGGEQVYRAREWGPRGAGFRVDTLYLDGAQEEFRSVLLEADGNVLERTHSLPLVAVPERVLVAATRDHRRDVHRVEIVSGPEDEELYRCTTVDKIGRKFIVECDAVGSAVRVARVLTATVRAF